MLVAEINGKVRDEVRDDEDYLTSAVFGHLRYVRWSLFWATLFRKAVCLAAEGNVTLYDYLLGRRSIDLETTSGVDILFWPRHAQLGEPEMAICVKGPWPRDFVALVEVKLGSPKSGEGEYDQLKRYLQITDDLRNLLPALPPDPECVVIYLTPRDSTGELEDSIRLYGDNPTNRMKLYQMRWQDLVDAIGDVRPQTTGQDRMILEDVLTFLKKRGLEHFVGFRRPKGVETIRPGIGSFYNQEGQFRAFTMADDIGLVRVVKGAWTNGN